MTLSDKILEFNKSLNLKTTLPNGFEVMNPFKGAGSSAILEITTTFYQKYYNDHRPRKLILGINPGRLGAGATGLPFTDTERLNSHCNIPFKEFKLHEPSSVFVYKMIKAYGGVGEFYSQFYINSVCPLGFLQSSKKGNLVNANYYDDRKLYQVVKPFIISSLKKQVDWGLETDRVWCMGSGMNYKYLKEINSETQLFKQIIPLDHPRYVVQYRSKRMDEYVQKYIQLLSD